MYSDRQGNKNFQQQNQPTQNWGHFPVPINNDHLNAGPQQNYENKGFNHDLKPQRYEEQRVFVNDRKPYQFESYQSSYQNQNSDDGSFSYFKKSEKEMEKDQMEMFCQSSENSNSIFMPGKVEYSPNQDYNNKGRVYANQNIKHQQSEPGLSSDLDKLNINFQAQNPCFENNSEFQYKPQQTLPAANRTYTQQQSNELSYQLAQRNQRNPNMQMRGQKDNYQGFQNFKNNSNTPDSKALMMGKAKISRDCYSYSYYLEYLPSQQSSNNVEPNEYIWPDILYTQKKDGEILVEWNKSTYKLNMVTFVDLQEVYPEKQQVAIDMALKLQKLYHPNLLNLTAPVMILDNLQTLVFRSESPDHISSWKQFCKTNFSLGEKLSIFRQLASALEYLHEHGIVHRDMHPTRIHLNNGIVKFNTIGLPYNFKKLLRSECFTGHVNFSAPEIIKDSANFSSKIDVWSLGCCLFYLQTKLDPFEGKNITETKRKIQNLQLIGNPPLSSPGDQAETPMGWHPIIHQLIYKCLIQDPKKRPSTSEIISLQDQLEYQTFGECISKNAFQQHCDDLHQQNQKTPPQDFLTNRVQFDQECIDYKGMNLNNRNCPWFFSKSYGHIQQNSNQDNEDSYNSIFKEQTKGQNQSSYVVPRVMHRVVNEVLNLDSQKKQSANLNNLKIPISNSQTHSQCHTPIFSPDSSPSGLMNSCFIQESPSKQSNKKEPAVETIPNFYGSYSDFVDNNKFSSMEKQQYGNDSQPPMAFKPQDNGTMPYQVSQQIEAFNQHQVQQFDYSPSPEKSRQGPNNEIPAFCEPKDPDTMAGAGKNKKGDQYKGQFLKDGFGEYVSKLNENELKSEDQQEQSESNYKTVYEGEWAANMRHGHGKQKYYDQNQTEPFSPTAMPNQGQLKAEYDGTWVADLFDGIGTLKCYFPESNPKKIAHQNSQGVSSISTYEGTFLDGKRHGQGVLKFACGSLYEGEFQDDHISGYGIFKFANSLASYQGNFEKGKFNGQGSLSFTRGNIVYQGEFVKGFLSGQGKLINMLNQTFYEGLWFKGKMHGDGILYHYEIVTPHSVSKMPAIEQERIRKEAIYQNFSIQGPDFEQFQNQFTQQELKPQVKITFRFQGVFKFGQRNGFGKQTTFTYSNDGSQNFHQMLVEGYWAQDTLQQATNCSDSQNQALVNKAPMINNLF